MEATAAILKGQFQNHHHERDVKLGISPRTLKQTQYSDTVYPYGVCEVSIE